MSNTGCGRRAEQNCSHDTAGRRRRVTHPTEQLRSFTRLRRSRASPPGAFPLCRACVGVGVTRSPAQTAGTPPPPARAGRWPCVCVPLALHRRHPSQKGPGRQGPACLQRCRTSWGDSGGLAAERVCWRQKEQLTALPLWVWGLVFFFLYKKCFEAGLNLPDF